MHPTQRGRIIQRFGDLIEAHADALAEVEVRDNGRLLEEMKHQIRYIPHWYHYYAGMADKIEGSVHPCDKPALSFSRHEFAILHALMEYPGRVLSRAALEERLYGWQEEVESNTVEVHIHKLRGKLGRGFVETVRGLGYRVAAETR